MALYVVDISEEGKVPFLRGILTRSLVKAGLSFDEAYRVADDTRELLSNKGEVSTEELRKIVINRLEKLGLDDAVARYRLRGQQFPVTVVGRDGVSNPFSRVVLEQSVEICSLAPDEADILVLNVENSVRALGKSIVPSSVVSRMVYEHLLEHPDKQLAERYLLWLEFQNSGKSLVMLIGGATGTGKSTIASDLAHRLNIVRTQSTDMLREVMRIMLPKRLLPTLHESSFNAYKAIPNAPFDSDDADNSLEVGYLTQAERVGVAISAVIDRARTEGVSIIVEGVHMHPEMMHKIESTSDAIFVNVVVASPKKKFLRRQLKGRGKQISSRRSQRYMDNFDSIWALQSFLISEAETYDTAIIPGSDLQDATALFMEFISDTLAQHFKGDPAVVLEASVEDMAAID